jgi:anti-anti-sigma factor
MEIKILTRPNQTVLRVKGAIAGVDIAKYSKQLEAACTSDTKEILVDLTDVTMLESPVIGATAYSSIILKKAGKSLVVLAPNHIKEIFVLCSLDKSFRIIGTEEIIAPEELFAAKGDGV